MTIQQALKAIVQNDAEIYCKICTVDEIDTQARTVDVSPLDGTAPVLGVNLQANQDSQLGVVLWPRQGSFVVVAFLNDAAGVVVLTDDVERMELKIGTDKPVEGLIEDGMAKLTIGETSIEMTPDKKIKFNGDSCGGLTITPELKTQLEKMTARIDGIIDAINSAAFGSMDGGALLQTNIKTALKTIVQKEDFSNIENKQITHGQ